VQFIIASSSALVLNDAKRQHLSTISANSDLSFTTIRAGLRGATGAIYLAPRPKGPPWWNWFVSNKILVWKIS